MNQPKTRPRPVRDPVVELLLDRQIEQGKQIDDLRSEVKAGFAKLTEHLADYPTVKAQVFDWRAHMHFAGKVAAWTAGVATFTATLVGLLAKLGVFQ